MHVTTIVAGLVLASAAWASPHHDGESLNPTLPISHLQRHQQAAGQVRCQIDMRGVSLSKENLADIIGTEPSGTITVDTYFHVIAINETLEGGWINVIMIEILN